uniref:Sen15 domain-containing protein n=1 Tax=Strongyloides venezuelensis TaxID=75913 RepID=A0A0K0FSG7_STRVS
MHRDYNQMAQNFLPVVPLNFSIDTVTQRQVSSDGIYLITFLKKECIYYDTIVDETSSTSNTTFLSNTTASEAASSPICKIVHKLIINSSIESYLICNESLLNPQPSSTNTYKSILKSYDKSKHISINY